MMTKWILPALGACTLTLVCSPPLSGDIRVVPDRQNVVASRLEGTWQLEPALTRRLAESERGSEGGSAISFKVDATVAARIPAKYEEFFANKRVYLAGMVTFKDRGPAEHPFLLTEHRGNPCVVWFREGNGEALGDAESMNVMLAVARDRQNDLLFIGGDFNNQPFYAYTRVPVEEKE